MSSSSLLLFGVCVNADRTTRPESRQAAANSLPGTGAGRPSRFRIASAISASIGRLSTAALLAKSASSAAVSMSLS